ncbi:MFS transporter [Alicyclobacillus cycloheptanicus]|uniref:MFS transporter n=1 Tax=Alicyclobacillus cycloheptanicus TaxID=1457 RepID=A0ABT9XIJ5_9BACL|nr:MFS transporter [Alicyclobacillus cycloheptanicus]MDQ0190108.1 putative MFS transporter [Alicyclobacillus cycloheptanicus]WDM02081.1 MFS transporter [Alicyclobacillus cycloheptanicus]
MQQFHAHTDRRIQVNLLSRLDRIPITKTIVGVIALLALVWLAEAFDIGIVGPVLSTLEKTWSLSSWQTGLLAISSTLGVVTGMIPAGWLADRIGRRRVVLFGILFFSILTLLGATASNYWLLLAIRLLAGIGEGAVLPMPYLFLSEFVNSRRRAVSVGYSNGILTAAYVIPNLASLWALHTFAPDFAWRMPFLLGGIPLLMLIPIYRWLPESPRYLLENNRVGEVQTMVERLEREAGLQHDTALYDERVAVTLEQDAFDSWIALRTMLRAPYLGRSLMVVLQLTAALILFYIVQVFGPSLFLSRGIATGNAILYAGIMMVVAGVGSVVQGYLSDRLGRKRILFGYAVLAAAGCLLFAFGSSAPLLIAAGFLTSFFGLGIFPVSKLSVAEQYPTELRGRGVYLNEMTARTLSGIVTTYFIPFLLKAEGSSFIFIGISIVLVAFSLPYFLRARETARVHMEEAGTRLPFQLIEAEVRA